MSLLRLVVVALFWLAVALQPVIVLACCIEDDGLAVAAAMQGDTAPPAPDRDAVLDQLVQCCGQLVSLEHPPSPDLVDVKPAAPSSDSRTRRVDRTPMPLLRPPRFG